MLKVFFFYLFLLQNDHPLYHGGMLHANETGTKWNGGFLSPWIAGFHLWDANQPRPMVKIQN